MAVITVANVVRILLGCYPSFCSPEDRICTTDCAGGPSPNLFVFPIILGIIDVGLWAAFVYLRFKERGRSNKSSYPRTINIILGVFSTATVVVTLTALAQAVIRFDLENLRSQDELVTKAYDNIKIQEAWNFVLNSGITSSPISVGIVDTGVDSFHQEFNNPKVNFGASSAVSLFDRDGHGTAVTGIIGANNVLGSGGSLPSNSPQMNGIISGALKENQYKLEVERYGVIEVVSVATTTAVVQSISVFTALESVLRRNPSVVNMSFAGAKCSALNSGEKVCYKTDAEFIDAFAQYVKIFNAEENKDTLFIAGAGNDDIDTAFNVLPASLDLPNLIAAGATDLDDNRTGFSNFGSRVHVAAPGKSVYTPKPDDDYNKPRDVLGFVIGGSDGTSFSAPMVTGVAAILKSLELEYQKSTPGLLMTPERIKEILVASADPISTDELLGQGCFNQTTEKGCRLNAHRAVAWLFPPASSTLSFVTSTSNSITLNWTKSDDFQNPDFDSYKLFRSTSSLVTQSSTLIQTLTNPSILTFTDTNLTPNTVFFYKLFTFDEAGLSSESNEISATTLGVPPPPPTGISPWPQFQHDERHTGQSPFLGPTTSTVKWTFAIPTSTIPAFSGFVETPVVGPNDTIYVGAGTQSRGRLFALNPDGSVKWQSAQLPAAPTAPAILTDGMAFIAVGTEDFGTTLFAFDDNGNTLWTFPVGNRVDFVTAAPDHTLYLTTENSVLLSLTPTSTGVTENWRVMLPVGIVLVNSPPAVGFDGTVYVINQVGGVLFARNPHDGSAKWTRTGLGSVSPVVLVLGDATGTVVVATANRLKGFHPSTGADVFTVPYPTGTLSSLFPAPPPVLLADGTIGVLARRVSTNEGLLHRINPQTATSVSSISIGSFTGRMSAPVTDAANTLYVAFSQMNVVPGGGRIKAFDLANTLLFEQSTDFITENLALGSNGTLYAPVISSSTFMLWAIGE